MKTKTTLRENVWWLSINENIENHIGPCHSCQITTPSTQKNAPLAMTPTPDSCWDIVSADIKGPFPKGENLLVLLDYKSRYPIVFAMKHRTTSDKIIKRLDKTFSMFDYPHQLLTDNGPQFTSYKFISYLKADNTKHHPITSYWPQVNGEVERFNRVISKIIQCASTEGKEWREEIDKFLLYYRTNPHTATDIPPAGLFL